VNRYRSALTAICSAACLLAATTGLAAGRYDARLRFHVLRTPHFTIYFHQGEAGMAARLAAIAERVRDDLVLRTGLDAPSHAHVVLVDQSDISNGWSTPVPYNLVEIAAVPPPPSDFLGNHDDWLRIVFAHEYAHVAHLDRVGGVMKAARWILGRNPATFPNLFVPQWQVEGFATWAESAVTGLGRMHASDVASAIAAASAGGRATIDRAGGGLVMWPSGNAPYFLGGRFDEALAARERPQALGAIARETARRLPFLGGGAYRKVLGETARELWKEVFAEPTTPARAPAAGPVRLTHEGFAVSGPRVVRRRTAEGGTVEAVFYSSQGPHRFPDIRMVGLGGGPASHVVSRYDGRAVASDGRWLYFDQLEFDGPSAIVADLHALDLDSGRERRLSRGERLTDPDVDASGERIAAVQARDGDKRLTLWRVSRSADGSPVLARGPERILGMAGCQYASPRWSPDAAQVAAVRQCPGSLPAIVEIAAADGAERVVAEGARNVTPTWSPDGAAVLFASDREDGRFKLFAAGRADGSAILQPPVLLLDAPGGVMWPDVAGDGRTVVFTSMTADGYDVFAAPLPPQAIAGVRSLARRSDAVDPPASVPPDQGDGRHAGGDEPAAAAYSPWRTLLPRAWSPLLSVDGDEVDLGATTGASDALGYHEYSAAAQWRVTGQDADINFDAPPVSWTLSYAYNRWRPSFLLSAWQGVDTVTITTTGSSIARSAQERNQGVFAGVLVPWRRVRVAQSWFGGLGTDERRLPAEAGIPQRSRNGFRAGWALNSSREYGYSISPEDGVRSTLNLERVTPALGADGSALTLIGDARAYVPGLRAHHVVAMRLAAAGSTGDAGMTRSFSLGGSAVPAGSFALGERTIGLLRGLPADDRAGTAVLVANLDYRFPIARIERGIRTWPFFLRDIHGAVFTDAGSAGAALDALPAAAFSVGAEIGARITLGYTWNFSVSSGAAWVHDPGRSGQPDRLAAFVRTGYAF
jgi:Tol biopolymer transport system component